MAHVVGSSAGVGLLGGEKVSGSGVGQEMEAFDALGGAKDVEVLIVDDSYFVVVAEVGIAAGLGKEVEAEGGVLPREGEHGEEGGAEVYLHGKAV